MLLWLFTTLMESKKKSKIDPFMPFVCQGWNTRVLLTVELYIIDWLHHEKNVFYSLWIIHNEGEYMYMYFCVF